MSQSQGTVLRNGKIIDSPFEMNAPEDLNMAQSNPNDSDANDKSDISSQLSEMKENNERKINELHLEFSQLNDLMMAVIDKTNDDSQQSSSQGPSKQPQVGRDMVTRVTENRSTRPSSSFPNNFRRYQDDKTDEEGDSTPKSNEERPLNAIETIPNASRLQPQTQNCSKHTYRFSEDKRTSLCNSNTFSSIT